MNLMNLTDKELEFVISHEALHAEWAVFYGLEPDRTMFWQAMEEYLRRREQHD